MITRLSFFLFLLLTLPAALTPVCGQTGTEGFEVMRSGNIYRVRSKLSLKIIHKTPSASGAIQFAVEASGSRGGDVQLHVGEFTLQEPIRLKDNVWLHGSGRSTVLKVAGPTGLLLEGINGAIVSDLSLMGTSGAACGVVIDNSGTCQVRNVYGQGFSEYGIWLKNNSFLCDISHCTLSGNQKANIYLSQLARNGRGGDYVPNEIKNCIVYRGGNGIECNRALVVNIVGCSVFQPAGHAFYIHSVSNSVLISGARSFQSESHAVVVADSHEINISGSIFCWQRGHGIVLRNVSWGSVSSNNVIDSGVLNHNKAPMTGIVLEKGCKGLQVTANAVFNWGDQVPMQYGVTEDSSSENNLIAHNNINFFKQLAVQSAGKGTLVKDNVSEGPRAYIGMDRQPSPDFDTQRIDKLLRESVREK